MNLGERFEQIREQAFADIAMCKDPRLIVLQTMRDTIAACKDHFTHGLEAGLNPQGKEVK
jgi:hypothetical protein